jgi:hypothetical protein
MAGAGMSVFVPCFPQIDGKRRRGQIVSGMAGGKMTISGKFKGSGFQYVSAALQNDLSIEESWPAGGQ